MYLNLPHENLKLTIDQEKIFVSMFKEKGRRRGRERGEEGKVGRKKEKKMFQNYSLEAKIIPRWQNKPNSNKI